MTGGCCLRETGADASKYQLSTRFTLVFDKSQHLRVRLEHFENKQALPYMAPVVSSAKEKRALLGTLHFSDLWTANTLSASLDA